MNDEKETARMALAEAVLMALEKGFHAAEIVAEVDYILETADE